MTINQPRQPKGRPAGGQFSEADRAEAASELNPPFDPQNPGEVQATSGPVRIELSYLGEGFNGDYDPDEVEDSPLYRVDVMLDSRKHPGAVSEPYTDWSTTSRGSSWCTSIPTDVEKGKLNEWAQRQARRAALALTRDDVDAEDYIEALADRLSEAGEDEVLQSKPSSVYGLIASAERVDGPAVRTDIDPKVVDTAWYEVDLPARTGLGKGPMNFRARVAAYGSDAVIVVEHADARAGRDTIAQRVLTGDLDGLNHQQKRARLCQLATEALEDSVADFA